MSHFHIRYVVRRSSILNTSKRAVATSKRLELRLWVCVCSGTLGFPDQLHGWIIKLGVNMTCPTKVDPCWVLGKPDTEISAVWANMWTVGWLRYPWMARLWTCNHFSNAGYVWRVVFSSRSMKGSPLGYDTNFWKLPQSFSLERSWIR